MGDLGQLFLHGRHYARMQVAGVEHGDAAGEVQELVALGPRPWRSPHEGDEDRVGLADATATAALRRCIRESLVWLIAVLDGRSSWRLGYGTKGRGPGFRQHTMIDCQRPGVRAGGKLWVRLRVCRASTMAPSPSNLRVLVGWVSWISEATDNGAIRRPGRGT